MRPDARPDERYISFAALLRYVGACLCLLGALAVALLVVLIAYRVGLL